MSHSPASRSALIDLVLQWHQSGTPWSPSGLGTRLDWGPPLGPRHEVLSCRQLNRVIDHAVDDLTITVEAGLPLQDLQDLLAEQGQWLPIDWPLAGAPGSIGGLVARGLAGDCGNAIWGCVIRSSASACCGRMASKPMPVDGW